MGTSKGNRGNELANSGNEIGLLTRDKTSSNSWEQYVSPENDIVSRENELQTGNYHFFNNSFSRHVA